VSCYKENWIPEAKELYDMLRGRNFKKTKGRRHGSAKNKTKRERPRHYPLFLRNVYIFLRDPDWEMFVKLVSLIRRFEIFMLAATSAGNFVGKCASFERRRQ